ncbi:MAG: hypothetical protein ACYC35_26405 [Pirellulales bacterium]
MITITRLQARQVRTVFRRALHVSTRGPFPILLFQAGPDGLRIRALANQAAAEYHIPGDFPPEELAAPYELLADCDGSKPEPVAIEAQGDKRQTLTARWQDNQVPQLLQYDAVGPAKAHAEKFPPWPESWAENPPGLLKALDDAMQTTDLEAVRFAINRIQLRGKTGTLAATDGRQLLIQSGFQFPWDEDILMPHTTVFGCRELPQDQPVAIGTTKTWVAVRTGPWTIGLAIDNQGRFPKVETHMPRADAARCSFQLASSDAEFLAKTLPRLPGDAEQNMPVTVDINGHVAVRARSINQPQPTELILAASTSAGAPARFNMNRCYLDRAIRLGFREFHFYSPESPALCQDGRRDYVWAMLSGGDAVAPSESAIRIESPGGKDAHSINPSPLRRTNSMIMSRKHVDPGNHTANGDSNGNGAGKSVAGSQAEPDENSSIAGATDVIQEAEAVKTALREAFAKTNDLITSLKRQRKQSRLVRSTLASLRQLQGIEA